MTSWDKSAADLEWPRLTDALASRCTSEAGGDRARALRPLDDRGLASARLRSCAEALALARAGDALTVSAIPELADFLARLARDAVATAVELHSLRGLLSLARLLRQFAYARRESHASLASLLHSDPSLDRLLDTLDHALDPDGGLSDRASADLAHARRRAADVRQRLVSRLDELIARYAEVLQDRYYTVRDGRYVLPVRSDAHIRVQGIVLASSASGATLFIEPSAVMSLGNQLRVAVADVEREEARLLLELTERVRRDLPSLLGAWECCIEADVLCATVSLAVDMDASVIELADEPVLSLRAVRHPLLALSGKPVVANDLEVRAGHVLVISGPNAGGKTVALKCLGLAAWMVRAGLPIPADPSSRVGWIDPVLTDVGDEQSIARSLSTFSAHVVNLAGILAAARPNSLVLLDELAGGTDPEEGSVLAAAVLDRLASQGAAVVVTTHYELLKTLSARDSRFENASVGFDVENMVPTFRVRMGVPGASSALTVAQRYGIPVAVIEQARALLPEHSVAREDVLRRIQDEQAATQLARHAVEHEREQARRLREELEAEREALRHRDRSRVEREGDQLLTALRRAREELRDVEARLRKKRPSDEDVREAQQRVDAVAQQVALGGELADAVAREPDVQRRPARNEDLVAGAVVYVPRMRMSAVVLERAPSGQLRVAAGPMKLFVNASEVQVEEGREGPSETTARRPQQGREPAAVVERTEAIVLHRTSSNTCDVRGLRVDEAISMVQAFTDRLVGLGEPGGFVLHGHGTGALRNAVREHLRTVAHVARSGVAAPEDGGEAYTALWVR